MKKENNQYTVGGLFSGIGGIELGFEKLGYNISWANEFDSKACETYRFNHKHNLIEDDIHNLRGEELQSVGVLTGGYPCQAFSVAGNRKGFDDIRGNLFFQIMRLVDELSEKPKVLFLENVKNFYTHDGGNTFKTVYKEIEKRGYSVFHKVLNTADYTDIPQNRERIFIICFRNERDWKLNPDRVCSWKFNSLFPPSKIDDNQHIKDLLENGEVDKKYYYDESKYMYNELKESMTSRDTVYQWRRKYVRENQSDQCPTLTANMGTGGHNVPLIIDDYGFRKLTPMECFKFQGFDDSFQLPPTLSNSHLYKQAGNSVTIKLIERLAEIIKISLDEKYEQKETQIIVEKTEMYSNEIS